LIGGGFLYPGVSLRGGPVKNAEATGTGEIWKIGVVRVIREGVWIGTWILIVLIEGLLTGF